MSRRSMIFVAIVILGIACLFALAIVFPRYITPEDSRDLTDSSNEVAESVEKPRISVESTHLVGRSKGKKRWEFNTDRVLITDDDDWVGLEGIRDGVFYDKDGAWMYFSAERARVNVKTDSLSLENVVFQSASGDRLSADTLTWDEKYGKVVLVGNVCIHQGQDAVFTCAEAEYTPGDNILETIGETTLEIELQDD
jgi:hypothetical protein